MKDLPHPYGCMAQFDTCDALRSALSALQVVGVSRIEIYSPLPMGNVVVPGRNRVALATAVGGILGGTGTLAIEYFAAVINYPIRVGGRPLASWPAFIPAALEMTLLFAVLFGVCAMLIGNRLPQFHHPVFNLRQFERASQDSFALIIRTDDPHYDAERLITLMTRHSAVFCAEVPR